MFIQKTKNKKIKFMLRKNGNLAQEQLFSKLLTDI